MEAPFVHVPCTPCPNISEHQATYHQANYRKPIQFVVANKDIRDSGQDKHDAAPPQHSPVNYEGSLALLSLLFPFQALPIAHCGSKAVEHRHTSIRECETRPCQPRSPGRSPRRPGGQYFGCRIDLFAGDDFGCAPERGVAQFRIPTAQVNAADDLFIEEALAPLRRGFFGLQNKFMEAGRAGEKELCAGLGGKHLGGIGGFGQVVLGQFADSLLAIDAEEDGGHQRD